MDKSEKHLRIIETGKVSDFLLGHFRDRIHAQKDSALAKLMMAYRSGKTDGVTLASLTAAYCALEDFETQLEKEVRTARNAAKEIYESENDPNGGNHPRR